jgi:branched-chain amino acid transport system permease protein
MRGILLTYQPLFDFLLLNIGFAYSQQIVLRAGVFSIAPAGFAALGAYSAAILVQRYAVSGVVAIGVATLIGMVMGMLLAIPLARLRGVYQAIATLAFVQIVVSLIYYAEDLTGGSRGVNNIPKLIGTPHLVIIVAMVIYLMNAVGKSGIGRAFDVIRQDETVAVMLGVSITRYHMLAFIFSGLLAGFFGGLQALYVYTIDPEMYGFSFVTAVLTFIILGGRGTTLGPIVGAAIMTAIPEVARPLAENQQLFEGIVMMLVIAYLAHGVVDGLKLQMNRRRAARLDRQLAERSADVVS